MTATQPPNSGLRGIIATWAMLLLLLAALTAAGAVHLGRFAPVVFVPAALMIVGVGFVFMRLGSTARLGRVFALAALTWLAILLGLGSMDPVTRTDFPVAVMPHP